ncbi:myeloid-associated differentiation marker-like protein [Camelus ferus]|nr:myeloid-associated differentiation marker-like protein [Camelus ferus]
MGGESHPGAAALLPKCLGHWFKLHILSLSRPWPLSCFQVSDFIYLQIWIFLWWVLSEDHWQPGRVTIRTTITTMFSSSVLSSGTILSLVLRLLQLLSTCVPFSLDGFLYICASYFTFFCLSAFIIIGTAYIQYLPHGSTWDHAIAATAFSCLASVLYATEVAWDQPALVWCVAVYSICFILGAVNFLVNNCDCDNDQRLPIPFPRFLVGQTVLSVLLYTSAVVLWPLY